MAELAPSDIAGDFHLGFAGDTFNTAWYLARCAKNIDVSFFTVVGDDAISQKMTTFMHTSGINTRFVQISADKTIGLYLITLDKGERSFAYWRGQSAARTLADDTKYLMNAVDTADVMYFSGITLAILDSDKRGEFLFAMHQARQAGKIIAFDPNLRPKLWTSTSTMTHDIMAGAAVSDIVLPSFEDEASWFNDDTPQATAERYIKAGAKTVIVKNGAKPVYFAEGDECGEVAVSQVAKVIDTTAAGDSFNAGIFAGYAAGNSLKDRIAYACNLANMVVQDKGALVPIHIGDL